MSSRIISFVSSLPILCIPFVRSHDEDFVSSFNKDNTYLASWFIKIESSNGIVSSFIFL